MNILPRYLFSFLLLASLSQASVVPNGLFSDHCVLQRGSPVPVWGTAEPGEEVTVRFRGRAVETATDAAGRWQVEIEPGDAGGPFVLEIDGTDSSVRVRDVLVGEVWLASGQSNMAWTMDSHGEPHPVVNGLAEMAKADRPHLRQFLVSRKTAWSPQTEVEGSWKVCSPETVPDFSAVAYFFAKDLEASLKVPIGIVHSSWGGTPAQAWTSEEAVSTIPEYAREISDREAVGQGWNAILSRFHEALDTWLLENDPASHPDHPWSQPQEDLSGWTKLKVPQKWDLAGYEDFDGVAWLRTTFSLPSEWSDQNLVLSLGQIDDMDTAWVNGFEVGRSTGWAEIREYPMNAKCLRAGENEVVVRIVDIKGAGGFGMWTGRPTWPGRERRTRIGFTSREIGIFGFP